MADVTTTTVPQARNNVYVLTDKDAFFGFLCVVWVIMFIGWWLPAAVDGFTQRSHWLSSTKVTGIVNGHNVFFAPTCDRSGLNNGTMEYRCYGGDIAFRYLSSKGENQTCTIPEIPTRYFQSTVVNKLNADYPIGAAHEISLIHRPKEGRCYWPDTVDGWKDLFPYDMVLFGAVCLSIMSCCCFCCSRSLAGPQAEYAAVPPPPPAATVLEQAVVSNPMIAAATYGKKPERKETRKVRMNIKVADSEVMVV